MRILENAIFWSIPVAISGLFFVVRSHSEVLNQGPKDHLADCVAGNCWVRRVGEASVSKLMPGQRTVVSIGDQVVTLGKGSFLAITLAQNQGAFRVRDTSVVTIEEGFKLLSLISSDGGGDEDQITLEKEAAAKAAAEEKKRLEEEERKKKESGGAAAMNEEEKKKEEKKEEEEEAKGPKAPAPPQKNDVNPSSGTIFLGKTSLQMKYPPKDTTFVSFKFPFQIPFSFETAEEMSESDAKLMGSWTLVQLIDEKNVKNLGAFEMPFQPGAKKKVWIARVTIPNKGTFAFVPTALLGDPQYQLRIRLKIIDREEYKMKIQEALKGMKPKVEERIEFLGN